MNCKKGDLARVVKPYEDGPLLGLYVSVVRPARRRETVIAKDGGVFHDPSSVPAWFVDAAHPGFPRVIADECLKPLRDNPGNEQFVVNARKSLPSTGPRIAARGEIA